MIAFHQSITISIMRIVFSRIQNCINVLSPLPTKYCSILPGGKKSQLFTREYFHQKKFLNCFEWQTFKLQTRWRCGVSFENSLHLFLLLLLLVRQDHFTLTSHSFKKFVEGFHIGRLMMLGMKEGAQIFFYFFAGKNIAFCQKKPI